MKATLETDSNPKINFDYLLVYKFVGFFKIYKFLKNFFALRNPQWFLDARSHWEVKITARNPDNLVEFLQKFTAQHHPRWGVFNRVLAHAMKLQILKKIMRFWKNALLSVIPLENLTPGRRKSLPGIKKMKIDCLLSVNPFDILKTTK